MSTDTLSHASISAAVRAERGLPENLIRLCVGIEDPRDLLDDLEHSLLSAGAITPNIAYPAPSEKKLAELFDSDPTMWVLERARSFKRRGESLMENLVDGVKRGLGLGDVRRKKVTEEVVVSAPGKVILFGEHAVVHGVVSNHSSTCVRHTDIQTAIATSVDLRCYSVLSARSDNKVALEAPNLNADIEWDISSLPWNLLPVATPGGPKKVADKELDSALLQAIESVVGEQEVGKKGLAASVAFLYLYMVMAGSNSNASVG